MTACVRSGTGLTGSIDYIGTNVTANYSGRRKSYSRLTGTAGQSTNDNG
jgi:hypothetical protein